MAHHHDDDPNREIRTHLELEAEDRVAEGMSEADARAAARRLFGSVARSGGYCKRVARWDFHFDFTRR